MYISLISTHFSYLDCGIEYTGFALVHLVACVCFVMIAVFHKGKVEHSIYVVVGLHELSCAITNAKVEVWAEGGTDRRKVRRLSLKFRSPISQISEHRLWKGRDHSKQGL